MEWRPGRCLSAILMLLIVSTFFPFFCKGNAATSREYAIKAVLLYRLVYYVQWPDDAFATPDAPIIIGILGESPFGNEPAKWPKKKIGGREVQLNYYTSPTNVDACHILFINLPQKKNVETLLTSMLTKPVLTVSDSDAFVEKGGMIGFIRVRNHPKLTINNAAARRARLKIGLELFPVSEVFSP